MLRGLKYWFGRRLEALGYTVIPNWKLEDHPFEVFLKTLFDKGGIDCTFDVGGHLGDYRDFLRNRVGFEGRIISFEPNPDRAEGLRRRAEGDPLWEIVECALGREAGQAQFNIMERTSLSSFLKPRSGGTMEQEMGSETAKMFSELNTVSRTVEVQVRTLDEEFLRLKDQFGFRAPYLKLDTQGFDLEVVRGGTHHLGDFVGLQTELSLVPIYEGMPGYLEVIPHFQERGFAPAFFHPVASGTGLQAIEVDCVMVRSGDAPAT